MRPLVTAQEFRAAMASFASGVTIITTLEEGRPYGLTATAFSSVCKEPPTCLICVSHAAEAYPALTRTQKFAVNVLARSQQAISETFATSGINKFENLEWASGPILGCPILAGTLMSIECEVVATHRAGDHDVLFGTLSFMRVEPGEPLLYYRGRYADTVVR